MRCTRRGSSGASRAIVDARVLGAMVLEHGLTPAALAADDAARCGLVLEVVLCNRARGGSVY